jgi:hypothetical protein
MDKEVEVLPFHLHEKRDEELLLLTLISRRKSMSTFQEIALFCWIAAILLSVNIFRNKDNRKGRSFWGIILIDVGLTIYVIAILYSYFHGSK